ncbi:sensor histidine kinase [Catenulispora acidiphila]|uniref:sensor histidine kinase n=1 Tax=Catenulispora acidiphila TaxID=304895 RepID=UPI00019DFBEC|nr:histidine kinase [Catenulispora acidiphila]
MDGLGFSRTELLTVVATVCGLILFGYADLHVRFDEAHGVWRRGAEDSYVWLFAILRALPILWCRRHPLIAFTATLAGSALAGAALASVVGAPLPWSVWPWSPSSQLCVLTALVVAGWEVGRRRSMEMATAYFLLTLFLQTLRPGYGFVLSIGSVIGGSALAVGCLELLHDRRDARQALAVQEELTEAERERRALLEERARIGRELHDVVAHHMSLLAVQAETAPFRITGQSPEAEAEFLSIASVSREALNDMRKLLGLLRADSAEAETAPQPRLADVPALVREAGAELETVGDLAEVPPLIGVTAYRVVQESLSNARRHARGAEVSVRIARTGEEVRIEVRNGPSAGDAQQVADNALEDERKDEPGDESDSGSDSETTTEAAPESAAASDQDPEPAAGQGIIGMRERVLLVHGDLETGPTANGGFAVTAVLPLESDA